MMIIFKYHLKYGNHQKFQIFKKKKIFTINLVIKFKIHIKKTINQDILS